MPGDRQTNRQRIGNAADHRTKGSDDSHTAPTYFISNTVPPLPMTLSFNIRICTVHPDHCVFGRCPFYCH